MKTARLLLPLLALLLATDADAITRRKACRLACGWQIDQCVAEGGRKLRCRRRVVRDCKRFGLEFCTPPSTTTTTLEPVLTPTTSTTFRVVATTTTTLPPGCPVDAPVDCGTFCCPSTYPMCGVDGRCHLIPTTTLPTVTTTTSSTTVTTTSSSTVTTTSSSTSSSTVATTSPPTTLITTTTTLLVTTTAPPTTTTSSSSTTSTILGFSPLGTWSFTGTLALNDCDLTISPGVQDFIVVSRQDGADISGLVGLDAASGTIDLGATQWELITPAKCDASCCLVTGFRAFSLDPSVTSAGLVIVADCGALHCTVGYVGTAVRQ